jgi:hypothetical protein
MSPILPIHPRASQHVTSGSIIGEGQVINFQSESKLVHVESKASILIANENRDVVQAKIGLLPIHVSLPTGPDYTY